eukprot:8299564-Pyramimonas_sp.AAC.2
MVPKYDLESQFLLTGQNRGYAPPWSGRGRGGCHQRCHPIGQRTITTTAFGVPWIAAGGEGGASHMLVATGGSTGLDCPQ